MILNLFYASVLVCGVISGVYCNDNNNSCAVDHWLVNGSSNYCIIMQADITVTYNQTDIIKVNRSAPAYGNCAANGANGAVEQTLIIRQSQPNLVLSFTFHQDKGNHFFNISHITVTYKNATANGSVEEQWSKNIDSNTMYSCKFKETLFKGGDFQITVEQLTLEAFQNTTTPCDTKNKINTCADDTVSNLVPIIVGACLGGLIVIVLIAYLVGRRRSRRGYESV